MTPLCARADLLPSDEHVVRIRKFGIVGTRHGVERANSHGVLVQHEEICTVLLLDHLPQREFHGPTEIFHPIPDVKAFVMENLHCFWPMQNTRFIRERDGLRVVLFANHFELPRQPLFQPVEDMLEHTVHHLQSLHVMIIDRHLQIQAGKFAQVTSRNGFFGTEHGSDLEYACQVRRDGHLLVQLRGLCQTRGLAEVIRGENFRTALACAGQQFWRMDFGEALRVQGFSKELAHHGLDA
mmetsp:Transcript_10822/g.29877  ORF Transcript_10822/g.29877 Transcript_10822/m.29877 type:complete len:239 (-) Transcript_10822:16-732(-)